ncbi:hypothetical protein [Marinobacter qingdaonensis]|uniref:Uncharacterized protein n=1 Tax=Marinobacter qingdaonensis TaxID=3108486 RepID=A0ABU5NYH5_9GAMM|nr:hypothetical protein [Marinobacter sp. ASW11-75]MEA1080873.1 hypothetical protein [Marinobacter sp. ASW11-75]
MSEQGKHQCSEVNSGMSSFIVFWRRLSFVERIWFVLAMLIAPVVFIPLLISSDTQPEQNIQGAEDSRSINAQAKAENGLVTVSETQSVSTAETDNDEKGAISNFNASVISNATYWGEYSSWSTWKVFIVPTDLNREEIISLARGVHKKYPETRVRFFDDDQKLQQQIQAEKYAWDTTGEIPRTQFPTEWRKAHQIAIINDQSEKARNRWQLIYAKGGVNEFVTFLD